MPSEDGDRPGSSSPLPAWLASSGSLAVLVLLAAHAWMFWVYVNDDAYITFRYSRNLASGIGPYFNAGEHVEGYTNFLLMVLLAPVYSLGGEAAVPVVAKALGVGTAAATLVLAMRLAWHLRPRTGRRGDVFGLSLGLTAAGLAAAAPGFAANSTQRSGDDAVLVLRCRWSGERNSQSARLALAGPSDLARPRSPYATGGHCRVRLGLGRPRDRSWRRSHGCGDRGARAGDRQLAIATWQE